LAATAAWDRFKAPILERLAVLDQAIAALKTGTLSSDLCQQAKHAAHKLAGSLGMFGFAEGSKIAGQIEDWLQPINLPTELADMELMLARLHRELANPPHSSGEDWLSLFQTDNTPSPQREIPLLLMVDSDANLTQQLAAEAATRNICTRIVPNPAQAIALIEEESPDAMLMDLNFPNTQYQGLDFLQEVCIRFPNLPILVFTAHDTFCDRLEVARRFGHGFISKSCQIKDVLDVVQTKLQRRHLTLITVLAVDDDPLILEALQRFLQPWGVEVKPLTDPGQFWETLNTTRPDLLILDIEMPKINGIELCQVVRNDPQWGNLPILFLSGRRDVESIHQIYRAGADDYIAKPCIEPELVTRVFNRLERHRLLRHWAIHERVSHPTPMN
jgi:DNA-binding response OmpR family regulator